MEIKTIDNKRSQGHIEMILSFVIFIGFVFAILVFINPVRDQKINYASVDVAENKILDNLSFVYSSTGLILTENKTGCFYVDNLLGQSGNIIVKDMSDNIVGAVNNYSATNPKIYIQSSAIPGNRYYKLYFSDKFQNYSIDNYAASCNTPLPSTNYTFGSVYVDRAVLLDNIAPLNKSYMADYSGLKSSFGVNEDFEFVVYNLNRTKVLADTTGLHKIKTSIVLARDMPLRVLDSNATASDIILNVRVW